MQCKCGGITRDSIYEVTTEEGAKKHAAFGCSLPLSIDVRECKACGRRLTVVTDANGTKVTK